MFTVLLVALANLYFEPSKVYAKGEFVKVTKLIQRSEINGTNYIFVSPHAAKIVNRKAGYKIIMKAPDWKVWIFNPENKVIYQTPWKDFKLDFDIGSDLIRRTRYNRLKSKKVIGTEQMNGFKTVHSRSQIHIPKKSKGGTGILNVIQVDYWCVDSKQIPNPVASVIQKLYRLPKVDGFPLKVTYITTGLKKCTDVSVYKVESMEVKAKRFNIPTNYKAVQKLSRVMLNMGDAETMIDLLLGK